LHRGIVLGKVCQEANPAPAINLLRLRRERPRGRAAKEYDELAPPHGLPIQAADPHPTALLKKSHVVRRSRFCPPKTATGHSRQYFDAGTPCNLRPVIC
jgi:hypothetical protein